MPVLLKYKGGLLVQVNGLIDMNSKFVKFYFLIVFFLGVMLVAFTIFYRPFDYRVRLYTYFHGNNILSKIGFLPHDFVTNLSIDTTEFSDSYSLVRVKYLKDSDGSDFHILLLKDNQYFIKSYLLKLLGVKNGHVINQDNIYSKLINIYAFNKYVKLSSIQSRDEVVDRFAYFLSNDEAYKVLENRLDIQKIINPHYSFIEMLTALDKDVKLNLVDSERIIFHDDRVFIWFIEHGLVQFNFQFEGLKIKSVETSHLGYLGAENNFRF